MTDFKKGILVVSFGTSYTETRQKTIHQIEEDIAKSCPDRILYTAFTSKMILQKLKERDGLHIHNVTEAMEQITADGITDLLVQPTHMINGIENDFMEEDISAYRQMIPTIRFGTPLLTATADYDLLIKALADEFHIIGSSDEALVLMGHGTTHHANAAYAALDYAFKDKGYANVFIGTVEAYPSLDTLIHKVKDFGAKKVTMAPLMIVAGDHAANDLAGESEDSWKSTFEQAGFDVTCVMKGLGEYKKIRDIFLKHVSDTL